MKKLVSVLLTLAVAVSLMLVPASGLTVAPVTAAPSYNSLDASPLDGILGNSYLNESNGKYLLHVEGTPYQMGFQQGYWLAEGVEKMTKDFPRVVLKDFGLPDTMFQTLVPLCYANLKYVPLEYRLEMLGIVDGAKARDCNVTYDDVLTLNIGFDVLLSVIYPERIPHSALRNLALNTACDGFVVYGNGTRDGGVLMGRDFMFPSEVIGEEALLIEYFPTTGYHFVSVTAPGFVGVTSAMNSKGIAIGMDMVTAIVGTDPAKSGMGCLFIARNVVQYSAELKDAVKTIRTAKRGVPWLYIVGDGGGDRIGGAIVETSPYLVKVRYSDYKYPKSSGFSILGFPNQIEDKDGLVVLANHYIVPEMIIAAEGCASEGSLWRYETLTGLLVDDYGNITVEKGKELVDYLHPPAYGYYGDDTTQAIGTSRTLYDLTNLTVWSLYGHYNDPWVHYKLG